MNEYVVVMLAHLVQKVIAQKSIALLEIDNAKDVLRAGIADIETILKSKLSAEDILMLLVEKEEGEKKKVRKTRMHIYAWDEKEQMMWDLDKQGSEAAGLLELWLKYPGVYTLQVKEEEYE